jgi:beta-N-acetylhexosaminidase
MIRLRAASGRLVIDLIALTACAALFTACAGTTDHEVGPSAETEDGPVATPTTLPPPDCAETLTPAAQAGQLLMSMVTAPALATEQLTNGVVGGFGLKGRQSAGVRNEIAAAVEGAPLPPFVAGDEEGGTVQRLSNALGVLPSAATFAAATPGEAAEQMGAYAEGMAGLGFNMNFGPVADVGSGSGLGSRSFGDVPSTVAQFTSAITEAQEAAGIMTIVKHWPGIGGGGLDPHDALDSLAPIEELRAGDLIPFDRAIAAGASGVMAAHAVVPGLTDDDEPVSLSRAAITGELRRRQGFDGLVITDSLGMGAVVLTTPQEEAAELAIAAGADIALVSGTEVAEIAHARLTEAIETGRLPVGRVVASVRRVLTAKGISGPCLDVVAAYSAIANGAGDDVDSSEPGGGATSTTAGQIRDQGINDTSGSG